MTAPGVTKTVVPCSCVGTCSVVLVTDLQPWGDEPHEAFVEFFASHGGVGLRCRLRAAWRVVWGRDPWLHNVCLDAEGIARMRAAFSAGGTA